MTPTQAQITLVANAIAYELNLGSADIRPHIERAAERAIIVAAEATDQQPDDTFDHGYKYAMAEAKEIEDHTIERCAQAIKDVPYALPTREQYIAAIRALKQTEGK